MGQQQEVLERYSQAAQSPQTELCCPDDYNQELLAILPTEIDEGHVFLRGERMAVCARRFRFLTEGPFKNDFIGITPAVLRDPPAAWCLPAVSFGTRKRFCSPF